MKNFAVNDFAGKLKEYIAKLSGPAALRKMAVVGGDNLISSADAQILNDPGCQSLIQEFRQKNSNASGPAPGPVPKPDPILVFNGKLEGYIADLSGSPSKQKNAIQDGRKLIAEAAQSIASNGSSKALIDKFNATIKQSEALSVFIDKLQSYLKDLDGPVLKQKNAIEEGRKLISASDLSIRNNGNCKTVILQFEEKAKKKGKLSRTGDCGSRTGL